MSLLVTTAATIMCTHGGTVTLIPKQLKVLIQGASVLCEPDLVGAPVVGCKLAEVTIAKPCTVVLATLPGSYHPSILVDGRPVYLATLTATTDGLPAPGAPPGTVYVVSPGQALVQA